LNVLFDLDGTLTDSRRGIIACLRYAVQELRYECPPDAVLNQYLGPPLTESFGSLLATTDGALIDVAIAKYRERFVPVGMFENDVYPGVDSMLLELQRRGTRMFVATSKPAVYASRIVEHFGLHRYFEAVYGSELDGTRTNKAELIAHILATERLAPSDTFMIGDRMHDMKGAGANRLFPIGALWGYGSREELETHGARLVCEAPAMLEAMLK
jgi:phosphoglycolate phosphatase